jgi:hypothetical protein
VTHHEPRLGVDTLAQEFAGGIEQRYAGGEQRGAICEGGAEAAAVFGFGDDEEHGHQCDVALRREAGDGAAAAGGAGAWLGGDPAGVAADDRDAGHVGLAGAGAAWGCGTWLPRRMC